MPTRVDITEDEVLTILVNHLRRTLDLSESRCYETVRADQLPRVPSGSDFTLTVSPGAGRFTIEEQFDLQCMEDADVTVMAFVRIQLDPSNPDTMLLHEANRGLLILKRTILKALVGKDLQRENGEYFSRDLIHAKEALAPNIGDHGDKQVITVGSIGVVFSVSYDWELVN